MNKKATDIVAYITIVGWLVAYFAGTHEQSEFHLNQGLILGLIEVVITVAAKLLSIVPIVGFFVNILMYLIDLVLLAFIIIGIVNAANGEEKPLPIIGWIRIL